MKKTSKILAIILAILMVLSIIPITASAEKVTSGPCGYNLTWTFDESTGTLTISGTGKMYDDIHRYYPSWHGYISSIESVVISQGVTTIGDSTFYNHENIKNVSIADSVTIIGSEAFYNCTGLSDVIIGDGVTTIGDWAFYNCNGLTDVVIGKGVTVIGDYAFDACSNLKTVTIYNAVETIGEYSFNCPKLTDVYYFGTEAEWNAITKATILSRTGLENATIHFLGEETHECLYNAVVTPPTCTEQGYTTYTCECGESYVDDYVNALGHTDNDNDGFCDICDSLVYPDAQLCGEKVIWTFDAETGTLNIWGKGDMYDYTINSMDGSSNHPWADFRDEIKSIVIGDDVTSIGDSAFSDCDYLEEVKFGKNVKTIGGDAFSSCDSLTNFVIPEGVTEIGRYAFYVCKNLTSVTFPSTLTYIGIYAFCECNSLPSVVIPINVESIDSAAFYNCDNLKDVYYEGTEEQMSEILPLFSFTPIFSSAKRHYNSTGADTHPYKPVITPPTCTEQGYTTYICDCGYSNGVDDYVDALGHNHTSEITTPATHTTTGVMTYTCACGDTYTETIDKLAEHNHNAVVTPPTCTEQGYTTYTCECGDSYVADYVNKTGHEYYGGDLVTIVPTCTEGGYRYWPCSNCDHIWYFDFMDAKGHWYEETITMPTCTEPGYIYFVCKCGDSFGEALDAFGHSEEIIPAVAPTCTETGLTEGVKCSECNEIIVEQEIVPALGHTPANAVEENYVAPTCTENGSVDKVVYCSVCDEEISRETETLEATGHADNDGDGYCDADDELIDPTVECECNCHKTGISKFFFNLILFFQKLFGSNQVCDCGVAHY